MESEQAERVLKIIADSLEGGKEFVVEQAPDVVQQLIFVGRVQSVFFVLIPMLVALTFFWTSRTFKRKWDGLDEKEKWEYGAESPHPYGWMWVIAAVLGGFTLLAAVAVAAGNLHVWLAPKVYVLEYLVRMAG